MDVIRFDEDVAIPITAHGSSFRIGALTSDAATGRLQVLHLKAGGAVGRHEAASRQLLAVVSGTAWVRGGDGARRDLRAGWGAIWEAGESHEAGTDTGCTAVSFEGEFDSWAARVTEDIVVADFDPRWQAWFDEVVAFVWPAVRDVSVRVDHVGSTSVPGLAAKPIIDMDVVVADEDATRPVIDRLRSIGYRWLGDLGVPGRQAFAAPADVTLPRHHLYAVVEGSRAHLDHVLLRDLLRGDEDARERYAALKRRNAVTADRNMDVYVAAKARLVAELLTTARAERGLPEVDYWDPDVATS